MKVNLENGLKGYTGRSGEIVYCYNRLLGTVYSRRNTYPRLTEANHKTGSITANLFGIQPSKPYKTDLYWYLVRYNALPVNNRHPVRSWSNLYLKLMYEMAKADPSIDLRTLTREEIYLRDLPCISVKKAVEAELLPKVLEWEGFEHQI